VRQPDARAGGKYPGSWITVLNPFGSASMLLGNRSGMFARGPTAISKKCLRYVSYHSVRIFLARCRGIEASAMRKELGRMIRLPFDRIDNRNDVACYVLSNVTMLKL
jgi:hypothetical protein